jgi:hypothetical protein
MREATEVLFSCGENGQPAPRFRRELAKLSGFAVTDQRKMPHRRHRAALGQADAAVFGRPIGQPCPWKFRPPAEPPRQDSRPIERSGSRSSPLGALFKHAVPAPRRLQRKQTLSRSSRRSWRRSSGLRRSGPPRSRPVPAVLPGLPGRGEKRDAPALSRGRPQTRRRNWTPSGAER